MEKRGQTGVEYMIVIGFVTFVIMSILVLAIFYSDQVRDSIKLNQVESFMTQLINSAETVFYSGEPSKTTIHIYLPAGVEEIYIGTYYVSVSVETSSGINKRVFTSEVPLEGNVSTGEGTKKIIIEAKQDHVMIS